MKVVGTLLRWFRGRNEVPFRHELQQFPVSHSSGPHLEEGAAITFFEEDGLSENEPFDPELAGFETGWSRKALLHQVRDLMDDGEWYTLAELSWATGASEASCSARVRDFRKAKYGGHQVDRRYVGKGIYQYRLPPQQPVAGWDD